MPIAVKGHMPFCPPPVTNNSPTSHSSGPINIPRDHRRDCRSKTNSLPVLGCEKASPLNCNSKSVPTLESDEDVNKRYNGNFFKSVRAFFKRKKHNNKDKSKSSSSGLGDLVDGKISRAEFDALVQAAVDSKQLRSDDEDEKSNFTGSAYTTAANGNGPQRSLSLTSNSSQRTRLTSIREEDERLPPSSASCRRPQPKNRSLTKARPISDPFDRKNKTYTRYLDLSDSESSTDSINDIFQWQV